MTDKKNTNNALLGDIPIIEGVRNDLLKFGSCAEVLARAVVETKESITIGIFGRWGTGKTSMMRLIMKKVDENENAVPVWFNAWQYEKEEHLIVPLTATITRKLDERLKDAAWSKKLGEAGKKLRDALRSIAYGFSVKGKIGIPLVSEAEVNLSAKDMIERYQDLTKDSLLARSLYFDAFEQLSKCNQATDNSPRVVVFIDDLDRCFPEKAVELLESVKLVLNQPGFSFVIGVHDEIIREFVKTKYAKECNIDPRHFEDYLDKIVQVMVPVPEREPDEMQEYVRELLVQAKVVDDNDIPGLVTLIAESCNRNPRSIVRLLNRIMVTIRIGILEGTEYDPTALILDMATGGGKFKHFRSILDDSVEIEGEIKKTATFGSLILDSLEAQGTVESPSELLQSLRKNKLKSRSDDLEKTITMLSENPHILTILKTDAGRKWLHDKKYRHELNIAGKQTLGETERVDIRPDNPIDRIIRNMVKIPVGEFLMGDKENLDAQPVHKVILTPFEIGAMPITQEQYIAVMGLNPSNFIGDENRPVENVSWEDANEFCKKISEKIGKKFTLPTEAQWEYACRAGAVGDYCFGNDEKELLEYAWFAQNSNGSTQPVGKKKPNKFGLYEMHGNVWEWCADWYGPYQSDQKTDPIGPLKGKTRVVRGGSWSDGSPQVLRCAFRYWYRPVNRVDYVGFRCVSSR